MWKLVGSIILNHSDVSEWGFLHQKATPATLVFDAAEICEMAPVTEWSHLKSLLTSMKEWEFERTTSPALVVFVLAKHNKPCIWQCNTEMWCRSFLHSQFLEKILALLSSPSIYWVSKSCTVNYKSSTNQSFCATKQWLPNYKLNHGKAVLSKHKGIIQKHTFLNI